MTRDKAEAISGSYGHGSMLAEDVANAALAAAGRIKAVETTFDLPVVISEVEDALSRFDENHSSSCCCRENLDEATNALADELCVILPSPFYYGSHEGDGSDFGIWAGNEDEEGDTE